MTPTDLNRAVSELLGRSRLHYMNSGVLYCEVVEDGSRRVYPVPDFAHSTDAILPHVEAHAKASNLDLETRLLFGESVGWKWSVKLCHQVHGCRFVAYAPTLPEALCRLLLAANGKEVK